HGGGRVANRRAERLARVDDGVAQRPLRDEVRPQDPVFPVDENEVEALPLGVAKHRPEVVEDLPRRAEHGSLLERCRREPPRDLDAGADSRRARRPDSAESRELARRGPAEAADPSVPREEPPPELDGRRAGKPRADDDPEKLRIGERLLSAREQTLPR